MDRVKLELWRGWDALWRLIAAETGGPVELQIDVSDVLADLAYGRD